MSRMTFEEWLAELDAESLRRGYKKPVSAVGTECWRGYYDDGYSPVDALDEDETYA